VKDLGPGPVPELEPGPWAGRKVALASAIASPESFERSAEEVGLTVLEHLKLRDHAILGKAAVMRLMSRAASAGARPSW
jgi:tetraacyldisaccharide-1-P 4'-kinase